MNVMISLLLVSPLCTFPLLKVNARLTNCLFWDKDSVVADKCVQSATNLPELAVKVPSLLECARACISSTSPPCVGANYESSSGVCELYENYLETEVAACPGKSLLTLYGYLRIQDSVSSSNASNGLSEAGCNPGWKMFQSKCYKVFDAPMTFDQADYQCRTYGASLASVSSFAEGKFIHLLSWTLSNSFYIGLIKQTGNKANPVFIWTDGSDFDYTNWLDGQPDASPRDALCTRVVSGSGPTAGDWMDGSCSDLAPFVCEKSSFLYN